MAGHGPARGGDPEALEEALTRAAVRICAELRGLGHPSGPADAREISRLASDLARLRGLPAAGANWSRPYRRCSRKGSRTGGDGPWRGRWNASSSAPAAGAPPRGRRAAASPRGRGRGGAPGPARPGDGRPQPRPRTGPAAGPAALRPGPAP
ncbi:DUF5682 family protein [Streptomyces sp. INA 01156]